jgi:phosphopantothenoylcysteine decarboxylase/phosphopantothenate--cysteine ligase
MKPAELLIGVTGGIAAYKTAALVSQLVQAGSAVRVVMTDSATRFVGPATFEALSGRPVCTDVFNDPQHPLGAHISLAETADLMCVAPATANFLAKMAHGIADDLLSTLYLSFTGSVLVAPAMNCEMWAKPAVLRNVSQLRADGVHIIDPQEGWLSCRTKGVGRMAAPEDIFAAIQAHLPVATNKSVASTAS